MELIDQKIEHHQTLVQHHLAIMVDLKIQRNRLAPISRLPPEMLYNIFFVTSQELENTLEGHELDWIKLTYVCHDWRSLALSSPSLWSKPYFENPAWAKEMLIRSKTANLTIQALSPLFCSSERINTVYNAFKTHMLKIKCININFPSKVKGLFEHLPEAATNLESLTLRCQPGWSNRRTLFSLPAGPPCGAVRLRQMDMSRIGIDWDVHLPSSLTSLKLNDIHTSFRPTMTQVWDALERIPLLETLELKDVLPTLSAPIISHRAIYLDHLQNLTIEAGIPVVECFLQSVLVPPTAIFDLRCFQDSRTGYVNVNEIIALLGPSAQILLPKAKYLVMRYLCHPRVMSTMKMQFLFSPLAEGLNQEPESRPSSHLKFSWYHEERDHTLPEQILQSIRRHFPLNILTKLHLYGHFYHVSLSTLVQTFGSLPHLQYLLVRLAPSILNALQSNLTENDTIPRASFSALRYLSIQNTIFRDQPQHSRGEISVQNLIDCLTWRFQHDTPMQGLDFKYCGNLNDYDVNRLNGVQGIAKVEWDRYKRRVFQGFDSGTSQDADGTESDSDF